MAVAMLAANGLAAAWGTVAWLRRDPSVIFWYLLRTAQVTVVLQAALGLFLLVGQHRRPVEDLHYVYGIAPLVIALVCEVMRVGVAQRELEDAGDVDALERKDQARIARTIVLREMGVMTIGTLLIVTLALRAGGWF